MAKNTVWFRVVLDDFKHHPHYSAASAVVDPDSIVDVFKESVSFKTEIPTATFDVYKPMAGGQPQLLKANDLISGCGTTIEEAVMVRKRPNGGGGMSDRRPWVKKNGLPSIALDQELVRIPVDILLGSGLSNDHDALLFRREEFKLQVIELEEKVLNRSNICWVLGPPGSGKSCTTFAWVLSLDKSVWVVTWVHLRRVGQVSCVRFINNEKWTTRLEETQSDLIKEILLAEGDGVEGGGMDKRHLVVLNGFSMARESQRRWADVCYGWRKKDKVRRRLVIDCSMTARGDVSEGDDIADGVCEHFVNSWTSGEYIAAMNCHGFFAHVRQSLDASAPVELPSDWPNPDNISTEPSMRELLRSKEYFSGASARYMFDLNTASVIKDIRAAIESLANFSSTRDRTERMRSRQAINRLFRCYACHLTGRQRSSLISSFAASELAMRLGPEALSSVMEMFLVLREAMQGWMMEMMFFQRLVHGGLSLKGARGKKQLWKRTGECLSCDTSKPIFAPKDECVWIKPIKWNQGGYDAVYIERADKNVVRFVQVTMGRTHSLKLQFLWTFLKKLHEGTKEFTIDKVEICFVVPQSHRGGFQIKGVSAEGILAGYGWEHGKEGKDAEILEIEVIDRGLWEGWPETDDGENCVESEGDGEVDGNDDNAVAGVGANPEKTRRSGPRAASKRQSLASTRAGQGAAQSRAGHGKRAKS